MPKPPKMKLASFKLAPDDIELLERLVRKGTKMKLPVNKSKLVRYAIRVMLTKADAGDLEFAAES
jgi:Arc/MetJ-type ribon-helix-helix transcriptional regulator